MSSDLLATSTEVLETSLNLEALIFASESTVSKKQLMNWLNIDHQCFDNALALLKKRLEASALTIIETASGFRLQISEKYAPIISTIWPDKQIKLSQALLETLSIIAYKQPVTRADIEQIRGVSTSSKLLRQLFDKGWIIEKGFRDVVGKPALLHTTADFLDAFSLQHLSQLPPLPELKPIDKMD